MFKSATLKLTLSYLAIISVLCVMFSGAIYHFATNELHNGLDRQSQRLSDDFPGFNFNPALRSDSDYRTSSHRILLNLIYFNLGVLVAAGFASYALARWTLLPIEQSHEQQKRFTADVSHELRTPLTALKMTTEVALLDKTAAKTALRSTLQSNLEEVNKLELLVNNLLRLTKLEASELQGQFATLDLSQVAKSAIAGSNEQAGRQSVSLQSELLSNLFISGDAPSLEQLVTIVLDNAIKYSPAGSTIRISTATKDGRVQLRIVDQGTGIEPADLPHIFERFYRADAARSSSDAGGFGLGLSIARMITELHRGRLLVTSRPGKGTAVTIDLAAAQA